MKYFYLTILLSVILASCTIEQKKAEFTEAYKNYNLSPEERARDLVSRMTLDEKVSQMMHAAQEIPHLDVPAYDWWGEALHGVARSAKATVFPQPIGLAATFDDDLIKKVGTAISDEARAIYNVAIKNEIKGQYRGLTFWSPNVNIFRDPRWGRGHETYGEDPYLSGLLGSAFVQGIQGDDPNYLKAGACAKHYVVHSGPEGLRHEFDAVASDLDLYGTYLPAFKALVDAGVESVMCAYNRTNGEPCCGSKTLLTNILRNNWGFKGHVVSDCGAIGDISDNHNYTEDAAESSALAIINEVNLNCGSTYRAIPEAIERGILSEEVVDDALIGLLKTRFKLGLFDPEELNPYNQIGTEVIHSKQHIALSREVAQKSIVLLKNKNSLLPLKKGLNSIFITGPMASNIDALLGNYYGLSNNLVTVLEGIVGKVEAKTTIRYKHGVLFNTDNLNPIDWSTGLAGRSDVTVAVLGITNLIEGEEGESIASPYKGDRFDIDLPESQIKYLKKLREKAGEKPIVVVLTAGSPFIMSEIEKYADAILFAWYPGEQGGNAVADILFGDAIPSGRLPITFPKSLDQLPPYEDYSMEGRTYRFMEQTPYYPFGYGLSYSTFEYGAIQLSKTEFSKGDEIVASVTVTNSGEYEAEEVVQLYVTDLEASFRVPIQSLKGVKRIRLAVGASETVSFTLDEAILSSVNEAGVEVFEPGKIKIEIGGVSPGAITTELDLAMAKPVMIQIN
ncbi:MAG: glycoside hydrolase family 3 C-terminal domain-containing protein [Prolixibacteraceae bacterium]|jgi:beta-glucosidase|nr:glycoside hydrolase family 3 C-terminal domain-containing protein [Prolixibacteraceae bacterium]